jgi:hypothetical protein
MERVFNCARVVSDYYVEYHHMLGTPKALSTCFTSKKLNGYSNGQSAGNQRLMSKSPKRLYVVRL